MTENYSDFLWGRNTHHIWLYYVTDELQTHKHKEMKKEADSERDWVLLHWQVCNTGWPHWKASISLATGRQLNSGGRF